MCSTKCILQILGNVSRSCVAFFKSLGNSLADFWESVMDCFAAVWMTMEDLYFGFTEMCCSCC